MIDGERQEQFGFSFGEFRLYPALRLLLRGGERLEIGQTTFSLAAFLIEHAGRQLSRDEIFAAVWRKQFVGNSTFANHVTAFRSLFGEHSLITINAQGYQCTLIAERTAEPPAELRPIAVGARPVQHLPTRSPSCIGRDAELVQAEADLGCHRLLSVIGPGGIGKTWLAIELGWQLLPAYPGGVYFIDLAPIRSANAVASAVVKTLGIPLRGTKAPAEIVAASIRERAKMLLIFDSCEYVTALAAEFCEVLLQRAENVTLLATSQQPFNISPELILRLGPLTPEAATRLFVERVRAADRRFAHDEGNAPAVAEICRRLGCIPHALELAAGRVASLGLDGVRAGLEADERFWMLDNGPKTASERQQTLRAAIEWSYGLLEHRHRLVFDRLSVFAGSFSRAAAIAVAGGEDFSRHEIIDALRRLVEKSLLSFEDGEQPRYRLLETLWLYGMQQLAAAGEAERVTERQLRYFIGVFDAADTEWETMPDAEWQRVYGVEIDNIRGALDWTLAERGRTGLGVALCGGAGRLWHMADLAPEGRRYCDQLIQKIDESVPAVHEARLLRRGAVLWRLIDRRKSAELVERSALLYRQIGDRVNLAAALALMGNNNLYLSRYQEAKVSLDEARQLLAGNDLGKSEFSILTDLGILAVVTGDLAAARQYHLQALEIARKIKDAFRESNVLINLGDLEFRLGAAHRAIECAREAASRLRMAGQTSYLARALTNLAAYHALLRQAELARPCAVEALAILTAEGGHWLRLCLQGWALIAAVEGRCSEAAQLAGYIDADYGRAGEIREPVEQTAADLISTLCAERLVPGVVEDFRADGAVWTEERAVDFTNRRIVSPSD
jgi:predicted ATPase/DNA-binding winged helix-turn-helix (wHTH) protein/tetratricopeptide (TPR) repeat protein